MACKELLDLFLKQHAPQYYPLPASTNSVLMCDKIISDAHQAGRSSHDAHAVKNCKLFLDYHVTMEMPQVSHSNVQWCTSYREDKKKEWSY
jgi:hypothetical protein